MFFDIGDNGKKFEKMNTIRVILGLISSRLSLFKLTGGHETELLLIFWGVYLPAVSQQPLLWLDDSSNGSIAPS